MGLFGSFWTFFFGPYRAFLDLFGVFFGSLRLFGLFWIILGLFSGPCMFHFKSWTFEACLGLFWESFKNLYVFSRCDLYRFASTKSCILWIEDFIISQIHGNFINDDIIHISAQFGHLSILRAILPLVKDKNPPNFKGVTPLHIGTKFGQIECVKLILDEIEDSNPPDPYGTTPLHIAIEKGFPNLIKIFSNQSQEKNPPDQRGLTPMHLGMLLYPAQCVL